MISRFLSIKPYYIINSWNIECEYCVIIVTKNTVINFIFYNKIFKDFCCPLVIINVVHDITSLLLLLLLLLSYI